MHSCHRERTRPAADDDGWQEKRTGQPPEAQSQEQAQRYFARFQQSDEGALEERESPVLRPGQLCGQSAFVHNVFDEWRNSTCILCSPIQVKGLLGESVQLRELQFDQLS